MFSLHRRVSMALAMAVGAVSLAGCVVEPVGYDGAYYAAPAPVYVGPSYYYGPRYGHGWHRGGYWHGGGGYWHHH